MSWKKIIKEETNAQKTYEKALSDYISWVEKTEEKISEEELGWSMQSYFDGIYPDSIKNAEDLKKEIIEDIKNWGNNRHIDVRPLKQILFALDFSKEMMK